MKNVQAPKGIIHNPGVVAAEDPATGEPDPSVLKEVSEEASRGNDGPSEELAAATERRRARLLDVPSNDAPETKWQKPSRAS
jgi:hypothetical protein